MAYKMTESDRSGYKKCLVDMINMLQMYTIDLKSARQSARFIESLMMTLLVNADLFDEWIENAGNASWFDENLMIEKDGRVKVKK